jgi:hypothetical protein
MEAMATPGVSPLLLGEYCLPLSPAEYVRRNIRVTPLPVNHESPVAALEVLPEVPIFSSDYPHFEGSGDPGGHYTQVLAGASDLVRRRFLGENLASCFEKMRDPLTVPAAALQRRSEHDPC